MKKSLPTLTLLKKDRSGTWEYEGLSRREAHFAFREFRASQARLEVLLGVKRDGPVLPRAGASDRYVALEQRGFFAVATVVFASMAIESFLNYYGVRRFGPAFKDPAVEFLTAADKTKLILGYTCVSPPKAGTKLYGALKRLYSRRNKLIHPKTHEHMLGVEPPALEPTPLIAEQSIADMESFFEEFVSHDPDAKLHVGP